MVSINFLSKIKNNFAIIYAGHNTAIAAKLVILKKNISAKYPEVNLWYVFHENTRQIFESLPSVISLDTFEKFRNNFAKYQEVYLDPKQDSISSFCEENEIDPFICKSKISKSTNVAVISKNEISNIDFLKKKIGGQFHIFEDFKDSMDSFDTFVGKESPELLAKACQGKKIFLFQGDTGCISFRKMFPDTELFEAMNNR